MGNIHQMRAFIKMIFRQFLFQKLKFLMKTCQVFINDGRIGWLFHSLFLILKNSLFVVNNVPLNELNISHKNKKWNSPFYIYCYISRHVAFFFKFPLISICFILQTRIIVYKYNQKIKCFFCFPDINIPFRIIFSFFFKTNREKQLFNIFLLPSHIHLFYPRAEHKKNTPLLRSRVFLFHTLL